VSVEPFQEKKVKKIFRSGGSVIILHDFHGEFGADPSDICD
jgi:hypothetical protein